MSTANPGPEIEYNNQLDAGVHYSCTKYSQVSAKPNKSPQRGSIREGGTHTTIKAQRHQHHRPFAYMFRSNLGALHSDDIPPRKKLVSNKYSTTQTKQQPRHRQVFHFWLLTSTLLKSFVVHPYLLSLWAVCSMVSGAIHQLFYFLYYPCLVYNYFNQSGRANWDVAVFIFGISEVEVELYRVILYLLPPPRKKSECASWANIIWKSPSDQSTTPHLIKQQSTCRCWLHHLCHTATLTHAYNSQPIIIIQQTKPNTHVGTRTVWYNRIEVIW